MMSHETIESYYQSNFEIFFYDERVELNNNFTLQDFENMLPYEREIYAALMKNKITKIMENRKRNK